MSQFVSGPILRSSGDVLQTHCAEMTFPLDYIACAICDGVRLLPATHNQRAWIVAILTHAPNLYHMYMCVSPRASVTGEADRCQGF